MKISHATAILEICGRVVRLARDATLREAVRGKAVHRTGLFRDVFHLRALKDFLAEAGMAQ